MLACSLHRDRWLHHCACRSSSLVGTQKACPYQPAKSYMQEGKLKFPRVDCVQEKQLSRK
jgi:hypothetical protein